MAKMIELRYMSAEDVSLSLETAKLELLYQEALRQAERLYEEERTRALRVQLLLVEDDNDDLRDQMREDEDEMEKLETTNEDLHEQLATKEAEFQAVQIELKTQLRDLDRYKAEVNALNAASNDSIKLLSDKLALTREMATLKPELEHLKSQANGQQSVLAEKLALERELSAIQVELETERRAVQRMKSHDKTNHHGETVMLEEISDLKKELTKEKRNIQKQERDHMKETMEWEKQKETLENKLEAFRAKVRTTKEELKEAKDEIERAEAAKFAQAAEATKARMNGGNPRKRNIARFDPDMTIGTPGNGGPAKKAKTSILPGDKSSFSITPFLNKTTSMILESPSDEQGAVSSNISQPDFTHAAGTDEDAGLQMPQNKKPIPKKIAATKSRAVEPLKEITKSKANKAVKKPSLPKVDEEDDVGITTEAAPKQTTSKASQETADTAATKKQKTLSNRPTIFDEDEDAAPKRPMKKFNLAGLRGSSGGMSLSKVNLGGKNKVLAEFSPLKKDRNLVF